MTTCIECGATYSSETESCSTRFEELLSLDHSRTEPWGSRHALAFSAFALQHPAQFPSGVCERAWILLFKVFQNGDDPARVTDALRRAGALNPTWDLPSLPPLTPGAQYAVTIADLGSFIADTYPIKLEEWCRAALAPRLALLSVHSDTASI